MSIRRDLLDTAIRRLENAGVEDARRNAEWMLCEALAINRATLLAQLEAMVSDDERAAFEGMVARRERREPLQYVLGHADFFGLRLRVTPRVLIPRPETEELVETALERLRDRDAPWVLDIGTGSGAIALAIKHERADAEVFACDISEDVLSVASTNAERLSLPVTLICTDVLAPAFADGVPECFDLIVSNPPYVPEKERGELQPEVGEYEPREALFPGDDPLRFYRAIAGHAERLLKRDGHLLFEAHADHAEEVADLLATAGFADTGVQRDLAGKDRIVGARKGA